MNEECDPEIKDVLAALDDDEAIDEDLSEDFIDQLNASYVFISVF